MSWARGKSSHLIWGEKLYYVLCTNSISSKKNIKVSLSTFTDLANEAFLVSLIDWSWINWCLLYQGISIRLPNTLSTVLVKIFITVLLFQSHQLTSHNYEDHNLKKFRVVIEKTLENQKNKHDKNRIFSFFFLDCLVYVSKIRPTTIRIFFSYYVSFTISLTWIRWYDKFLACTCLLLSSSL